MRSLMLAAASLLGAACVVQGGSNCDEKKTFDERTAETEGAERIRIIARAGELNVNGAAGDGPVKAWGEACASNRAELEEIDLRISRQGDEVMVETIIPDRLGSAHLHLEVELPDSLPVVIDDRSGSATIRGVAGLEIEDGSGELEISDIRGDLSVDDGSGSIEITGVDGDVRVDDGSGGMRIRRVKGSVFVEDGSGGIDVAEVDGDFIVIDDGSGGIDTGRIAGTIQIKD